MCHRLKSHTLISHILFYNIFIMINEILLLINIILVMAILNHAIRIIIYNMHVGIHNNIII